MAKTSTLGSPGIEVNEVDNSIRPSTSTACTVLVPGFASLGPVEEISSIGGIDDFETMFGKPTNAAERYFYHSVKTLDQQSGAGTRILVSRLPYGQGEGDNISSSYTLLAYPAIPVAKIGDAGCDQYLFDEGELSSALTLATDAADAPTSSVAKFIGVKTAPFVNTESGKTESAVFSADSMTITDKSTRFYYNVLENSEPTASELNKLKEAYGKKDKDGIYKIEEGTTVKFFVVVKEVKDTGDVYTAKAIDSTPISDISKFNNAKKAITSTSSIAYSTDEKIVAVRSTVAENGYAIVNDSKDMAVTVWKTTFATPSEIKDAYDEASPAPGAKLFDNFREKDNTNNCYVVIPNAQFTHTNFVQGPSQVSYDLIVENNALSSDESVIINSLSVCLGDTEDRVIPEAGDGADIKMKWITKTGLTNSESVGKLATENQKQGTGTVLNISIPVTKDAETQIGVLRVSAAYDGVTVDADHAWKFANITSGVKSKFNAAYKVLTNSFRCKDEETGKIDENKSITYVIGSPVTYNIPASEYNSIMSGEAFSWGDNPMEMLNGDTYNKFESIKNAAFIVINKSRTTVNEGHEGYYVGISDNMFVSPSDEYVYNAIDSVKGTTKVYQYGTSNPVGIVDGDFDEITKNRLNFYLDSNYQGSISRLMENGITKFDMSSSDYDDTLNIGLFKLNKASTAQDALKLSYSMHEGYNASFGAKRQKSSSASSKAVSYFIENEVEDSYNMNILVNPNVSASIHIDTDGNLLGKMRVFGTKLIDNLSHFEKKYLVDGFNKSKVNTEYDTPIAPIRLAKQSVESYQNMMEQAGLSIAVIEDIKKNFTHFNTNSALYQFGAYLESSKSNKQIIGNVPAKIERMSSLIANDEEYPDIDIILEAGLGTIYAYSNGASIIGESSSLMTEDENTGKPNGFDEDAIKQTNFVDSLILEGVEDLRTGQSSLSDAAQSVVEDYTAVQNAFLKVANAQVKGGRGDTFFISDVLRGIVIKGKDTKISKLFGSELVNSVYNRGDSVKHSWSTSVYYPIKHLYTNITTNYMSAYAQWFKVLDEASGEKCWVPASAQVASLMASADAAIGPWSAAAGINRGIVLGVLDYALSPDLSQRTDLYGICVNSIPKIPNTGICVWGIRTMGRKDSAFDQNTCRRTVLYIEKIVKRYLRNYLFEQNTTFTRLSIVNDLEPLLESIMNAGGIYSYTITCDTTNNTPEIINNGDLAVDISVAPTRTAENIVLTMIANKYTNNITSSSTLS